MTDAAERLDDGFAELAELSQLELEPELDPGRDDVTLVVVTHHAASGVSHDGVAFFDDVLRGIAAQTRAPERIVFVDTSQDAASAAATAKKIARILEPVHDAMVLTTHQGGFATALRHGLSVADSGRASPGELGPDGRNAEGRIEWVWVLHDDSAPAPDALERMLRHSALSPSSTVMGPKCLDFDDPRMLVEAGVTTDRAGRRETGLERRELDQGQHDAPRDVLSVGSAGMLVRRDVWQRLQGFDPELDFARDDLDFGWRAWLAGERVTTVPSATVRHARCISRGLRTPGGIDQHRRDRRNAAYVVLVNSSTIGFVVGIPRLLIGVLARSLGHLLTRSALGARSDLAALPLLMQPGPLVAGRRRRAGQAVLAHSTIDPLLASRAVRLRGYVQAGADWLSGGDGDGDELSVEMGGGLGLDDDADGLSVLGSTDDTTVLRRLARKPALFLALILTIVSVIASRGLLGRGPLAGGRLLPVPAGSHDLWVRMLTSWHDVGLGVSAVSSMWTGPLALLSSLTLGKPWIVIDLLLIGLPVLCAASVWRASRSLALDTRVRAWAAAAYGLSPATIGVMLAGRFDVAWALAAAPVLARRMYALVTSDEAHRRWHTAWALGLWLALAAAFWPPIWVLAVGFALVGVASRRLRGGTPERPTLMRVVVALATPGLLGLSGGTQLLRHPEVLLSGWGAAGAASGISAAAAPGPLDALFAHTTAGVGAIWLTAPLLLAAVAGYLRPASRRIAAGCIAASIALIGGGVFVSRLAIGGVGNRVMSPDGYFALACLALVVASVFGAKGLNSALAGRSFSWRQPAVAVLATVTVVLPFVSAMTWMVNGDNGPLQRAKTAMLPAFVTAETSQTPGARVLFLDRGTSHVPVRWSLSELHGPLMGDEDVDDPMSERIASVVSDLTSRRGTDAGELLSTFAVAYIAIPNNADDSLVAALDEAPALSRVAFVGALRLWRPTNVSARVLVIPPISGAQALAAPDSSRWSSTLTGRGPTALPRSVGSPQALAIGVDGGSAAVPVGIGGRLVVLSVPFRSGWKVTYSGHRLGEVKAWGWASAYVVPTTAGELRVSHDSSTARGSALITGLMVIVVLVLAAPDLRRNRNEEDGE